LTANRRLIFAVFAVFFAFVSSSDVGSVGFLRQLGRGMPPTTLPTSEDIQMNTIRSNIARALIVSLFPVLTWAGPVDINRADAQTLATELEGVGLSKAEAIVAYRQEHGPFKSPEDLLEVKGVGPRILEQNRANIKLNSKR
jgi:competence protein ComEA